MPAKLAQERTFGAAALPSPFTREGLGFGWLPDQANRFSPTNRGVAIGTREVTYLGNSRTADSFFASALCGGAIGKPNFGFPRARIRDIEPSVQGSACADPPPVLRDFSCT